MRNTRCWHNCIQSKDRIKIVIPETNIFNQYLGHDCLKNDFLICSAKLQYPYRAPHTDAVMLTKLSFPLAVRKSEIRLSKKSAI